MSMNTLGNTGLRLLVGLTLVVAALATGVGFTTLGPPQPAMAFTASTPDGGDIVTLMISGLDDDEAYFLVAKNRESNPDITGAVVYIQTVNPGVLGDQLTSVELRKDSSTGQLVTTANIEILEP